MKIKLLVVSATMLLGVMTSSGLYAGTCSSISRSDNAANSILTSTKYNTDVNTAYSAINAFDGGCVTDGTLEKGALSTSDFAVPLNAIREGCTITNTDSNTIQIDRCMLSVNGSFVKTTSANTVTWGCSGCSSEVASTKYYVYVKNGSASTTMNLLISTTGPNADGYDSSSNRIVGTFFNNSSSNIDGVETWSDGGYRNPRSMVRVQAGAGAGATNTKIRRFTNILKNIGSGITYADSANNGASFTINETGLYTITFTGAYGANANFGVSLNSSQLTTNVQSITAADRLVSGTYINATDSAQSVSWTGLLTAADVIRAHDDGAADGSAALMQFTITKVSY